MFRSDLVIFRLKIQIFSHKLSLSQEFENFNLKLLPLNSN